MTWWIAAIGGIIAFLAGGAFGVSLAIRFTRWREREWLRNRCREAAKRLALYFGNPVILLNMQARSQKGHNYLTDKQFAKGLRETLERVFRVSVETE